MRLFAAAVLFSTLSSGCTAGFYLVGATPHSGPPVLSRGTWRVSDCASAAGQPIPPPSATYYLDDQALYEIDASGSGARITNGWSDASGRYFFTRVKTSHGWLYFFPADRAQPPVRLVYPARSYGVDESMPGVMKPTGAPGATCTMVAVS
jgi:hypothetical protein